MLLIDFYCKAGGASMGYQRAGFDVVGVDIAPQPRYPFPFLRMDALEALRELRAGHWLSFAEDGAADAVLGDHGRAYPRQCYRLESFAAAAASPPCQRFSPMTARHGQAAVDAHPDLIEPTRELLAGLGIPYVIENVVGAPLIDPVTVCGKAMGCGLPDGRVLKRHRLFESNVELTAPACTCRQRVDTVVGVYGGSRRVQGRTDGKGGDTEQANRADAVALMGIDWMSTREMTQAIPPAYTEHLGRQLIAQLS